MKNKLHIVSLSGGIGSFIELCLVKETFGVENTLALFADVKMEDPDLYRFLKDSIAYVGCKFELIADGRDPWQVFNDVKFLGSSRFDPCSKILKRVLIRKHILKNYNPQEIEMHIGIDYNEKHRLEGVKKKNPDLVYRSLQVEKKYMLTYDEKIKFVESKNIKVPFLYTIGMSHNNCGGFCVKAGLAQFEKLYRLLPDRYEWHVQRERELRKNVPRAKPFLKKMIKGKVYYLWLEDYREMLRQGEKLNSEEKYDFGGCACGI